MTYRVYVILLLLKLCKEVFNVFFQSPWRESVCWDRFFTKKFWDTLCKIHPTANIQQNWNLLRRFLTMSAKGVLVVNATRWSGPSVKRTVMLLVMMMIMMSLWPGASLKRIVAEMGLTMYQSITPTSQQGVEEEPEVSRIRHHCVLLYQHEDDTLIKVY